MRKLFIVCWGSAGSDDDCNAKAFCGVHGVYGSLDEAVKGLIECKDELYNEVVNNPDYDEESKAEARANTQVYGSEREIDQYFEIDYFIGDTSCELYITIVEKQI